MKYLKQQNEKHFLAILKSWAIKLVYMHWKWGNAAYIFDEAFILQKIERSSKTMLDRWSITITDQKGEEEYSKGSKDNLNEEKRKMVSEKIPFNIINNYFSIGVVSNSAKSFSRFLWGKMEWMVRTCLFYFYF